MPEAESKEYLFILLQKSPEHDDDFEFVTVNETIQAGDERITVNHRAYETTKEDAQVDLNNLQTINDAGIDAREHKFNDVYCETQNGTIYRLHYKREQGKQGRWEMTESEESDKVMTIEEKPLPLLVVGKSFETIIATEGKTRKQITQPIQRITVIHGGQFLAGNRDTDIVQRFQQSNAPKH